MAYTVIKMMACLWMQQSIDASTKVDYASFEATKSDDSKPNIVFILVDDLGWGNVGFHNHENPQTDTSNIDELAATGLELARMYVYAACSPTRSSFQTGRLPVHVSVNINDGIVDSTHGIPLEMTGIASKLKEANYATHYVGKWDGGFASYSHLPTSKGYDSFYGYLDKSSYYYGSKSLSDCPGVEDLDLWENDSPADAPDGSEFIEFSFRNRALEIIERHDSDESPLLLVYASHLPHDPLQVPRDYLEAPADDDESGCRRGKVHVPVYPGWDVTKEKPCRTILQSMVNLLDDIVGEIVGKLKDNGLWANTLLIVQSDNGGDIRLTRSAGNNYPLRGGKTTDFEGGIRSVTVVNGGYLPEPRRGTVEDGMMHIADWYVTWCSMLGIDPSDTAAVAEGLPDVDGYDMWPLISGEVTESPRTSMAISYHTFIHRHLDHHYKLMTSSVRYNFRQQPVWPTNESYTYFRSTGEHLKLLCGETHCLFDLSADPFEEHNLAEDDQYRHVLNLLVTNFDDISKSFWNNTESGTDSCPTNFHLSEDLGKGPKMDSEQSEEIQSDFYQVDCGCWMAVYNYGGTDGPYQDVPEKYITYDQLTAMEHEHDHFEEPGNDISSVMRHIKDDMDAMNEMELEWIEQYQEGPDDIPMSQRVWDGSLRRDDENQTLQGIDTGKGIEIKPNSFSDGGLGAPTVTIIGVAVMTLVCLFAICSLARCLKARQELSILEATDSYGTVDGYIL